jgi:hypothetical protein
MRRAMEHFSHFSMAGTADVISNISLACIYGLI